LWERFKNFYIQESGGKKTIVVKRAAISLGSLLFVVAVMMAWFAPNKNQAVFQRTNKATNQEVSQTAEHGSPAQAQLFASGEKQLSQRKQAEAERRKRKVTIKYYAPQVLGQKTNGPKAIRSGSKLLGFLMNAVDTREPSIIRVLLPQGGESAGVEIERGSVLVGQFSYSGSGDKVFINFHRLDTSSGQVRKLVAQALDSKDYSVGVRGEVQSDNTIKLASQIGLSMFAGMADALTEKESMGFSQSVKPTMKNGLLQGVSRAAQDQAGRASGEIQSMKDYVVLQEGKEMIIQLLEDFQK